MLILEIDLSNFVLRMPDIQFDATNNSKSVYKR